MDIQARGKSRIVRGTVETIDLTQSSTPSPAHSRSSSVVVVEPDQKTKSTSQDRSPRPRGNDAVTERSSSKRTADEMDSTAADMLGAGLSVPGSLPSTAPATPALLPFPSQPPSGITTPSALPTPTEPRDQLTFTPPKADQQSSQPSPQSGSGPSIEPATPTGLSKYARRKARRAARRRERAAREAEQDGQDEEAEPDQSDSGGLGEAVEAYARPSASQPQKDDDEPVLHIVVEDEDGDADEPPRKRRAVALPKGGEEVITAVPVQPRPSHRKPLPGETPKEFSKRRRRELNLRKKELKRAASGTKDGAEAEAGGMGTFEGGEDLVVVDEPEDNEATLSEEGEVGNAGPSNAAGEASGGKEATSKPKALLERITHALPSKPTGLLERISRPSDSALPQKDDGDTARREDSAIISKDYVDRARSRSPDERSRVEREGEKRSGGRDRDRDRDREERNRRADERERREEEARRRRNKGKGRAELPLFFVDDTPGDAKADEPMSSPTRADDSVGNTSSITANESGLLLPGHIRIATGEEMDEAAVEEDLIPSDASLSADEGLGVIISDSKTAPKPGSRYFQVAERKVLEEDETVCVQCKESGHTARECPHLVCFSCGAVDQHRTRDCHVGTICFNCSKRGHTLRDCPEPRKRYTREARCDRCGLSTHRALNCPTIWRIYHYYTPEEKLERDAEARRSKVSILEGGTIECGVDPWCARCAGKGHWLDDCPKWPSREPSAFGWYNALSGPFGDLDAPNVDFADTYKDDAPELPGDVPTAPGRNAKKREKEKLRKMAQRGRRNDDDDAFELLRTGQRGSGSRGNNNSNNNNRRQEGRHKRDFSPEERLPYPPSWERGYNRDRDREEPYRRRDDYERDRYPSRRGDYRDSRRERDEDDDYYGSSRRRAPTGPRYRGGYSR